MLRVLSLRRSSAAYSVVVLPEPVGPVTSRMPCGLWISSSMQLLGVGVHAEAIQVEPAGLLVEQTQHHALAVAGRDGRDAHVDRAAGDAQADAAVLGQALLGDVELGHDLDARDHQRRDAALGLQHLAQHAVDAEAHHQAVLERLDVDVGGVLADRLGQQRIDQADDRRVIVALEQIGLLGQILRQVRQIGRLPRGRAASTRCCRLRRSCAADRRRLPPRPRSACSGSRR